MANKPRVRNKRRLKQIVVQLEEQMTALADIALDFTDDRYKRYSAGFEVAVQGISQAKAVVESLDAII